MYQLDIAKIQHYVPRFILKNFSDGKKLQVWVFDKKTGNQFKTHIKNIASESGFYNFNFKGESLTIEPSLSDMEAQASEILKRILAERNISILRDEEKLVLSRFIALQFVRTRQWRELIKNVSKEMKKTLKERGLDPEEDDNFREINEIDAKLQQVRSILKVDEFTPHFYSKKWVLLKANNNNPFYISDNPIALQNMFDYGPYGNIGLAVKGIEIYFPISKTYSIAMWCKSLEEEFKKTYEKYLFISRADPVMAATMIKNPLSFQQIIAGLETGRPIKSEETNIINHNSLQVKYSNRFIYSSKPNFNLTKEMLKDDPSLSEGPKIKVG